MRPLEGVTVLDFTQAYSGPYCTVNLADYGARVIKVERVGVGDQTREWMPIVPSGGSGYYALYNRNKECIAIDLSQDKGKEIIKRIAAKADIVVNNFKVGTLDKLGIGYSVLKEINPDIVFTSISGYGQNGPMAKLAAYDNIIEATCGLMGQTGIVGKQPVRSGCSIGDSYTGLMAAVGTAAAYYNKLNGRGGQQVDVAMEDSLFAAIEDTILEYFANGKIMDRPGNSRTHLFSPYDVVQVKDGWCTVSALTDKGFEEFCKESGNTYLLADERFKTNAARCENNDALMAEMQKYFIDKSFDDIKATFSGKNFAAVPVLDAGQTTDEKHMADRDMVIEIDDPNVGLFKSVGFPVKFEKTPGCVAKPSSLLGEHTEKILKEFGYSEEEIAAMLAEGVVEKPGK